MNGGLIVVQLGVDSFQQWVKEGVILLSRSFLASLPVAWSEAQEHADGDPNLFLIQLPEKYGRALSVGRSVYALIDEAKAISLPTRDLTLEWQSRMANLGEEWLPFQPKPEWVQVCTPEDLTGVYEKADYKSDSCEPDDSVVGEVSCTLSEPEQCSGCVENPASVTSAPLGDRWPGSVCDEAKRESVESHPFQQSQIPGFLSDSSDPTTLTVVSDADPDQRTQRRKKPRMKKDDAKGA